MLAKLTSKNQITIPKGIMAKHPNVQYFDVDYANGRILLKPLMVRQFAGFQPFDLESGAGHMDRTIGTEVFVPHRLIVAVVKGRAVLEAVKKFEGVVVEEVGRRGCKPEQQGIEMVENPAIALFLVDRTVAFVGNDQIVVAGREDIMPG